MKTKFQCDPWETHATLIHTYRRTKYLLLATDQGKDFALVFIYVFIIIVVIIVWILGIYECKCAHGMAHVCKSQEKFFKSKHSTSTVEYGD